MLVRVCVSVVAGNVSSKDRCYFIDLLTGNARSATLDLSTCLFLLSDTHLLLCSAISCETCLKWFCSVNLVGQLSINLPQMIEVTWKDSGYLNFVTQFFHILRLYNPIYARRWPGHTTYFAFK
uniref:Uncharacterized protein n=1 Tax=Schistocephalus solidus TaxID=70667 RepID=A0A0X3NVE0_SCHSO